MAKRARRRAFIRRKRVTPKKEAAAPVVEQEAQEEPEDYGFVSGYRAGDFAQDELVGDFVRDNEVEVSDETFAEFEKVFGTNEQLLEQGKKTADAVGKAVGTIGSL